MQIKEVQEKLKISSYTLRYYEKMRLIQPYRDENGYRNYNEEDIHKIERIMFLRDINVPIEDIKDILDNKVTFQDVLENHIEKVNTEIESLQYIKNMCEDLKEKDIPLEYPEMTLFMIIELVSSTVFTSIVESHPLPIEEFKPHLYKIIRLLINE